MQNYPPAGAPNYSGSGMPQAPAPKSKKPWIIGGVIGCLLLIFIIVLAVGGLAYFGFKRAEEVAKSLNANQTAPVKSENTKQYVNSREGRTGGLAANFVDFSFDYPESWELDPNPAPNFVRVERKISGEGGNFTQENFAVGWVSATGTALDKKLMPQLATQFNTQFASQFPNYKKVSEGETKIGSYEAYEFRFTAEKNNVEFWGRVAMLPPPAGQKKGVALVMIASDRAPELTGVEDVGERGELPVILESFRFGADGSK
ncbi:MAG TPA: PsbP-related protein [Pyrinomonadaceae bacterium]|nr:PsbP-related protein [Pyrinomonadaceae bacterium]